MRLSNLIEALPTVLVGASGDMEIHGISADSRLVQPGDLFIAIPGVSVDGHDFIGDALDKGAVAVIGELTPGRLVRCPGEAFTYVRVPSSREAWGWMSAAWYGYPAREMTLIGVTGTDGKTTTVTLIHGILSAAGLAAGLVSTVKALIPAQGPSATSGEASVQRRETVMETGLHTTTPDPPQIQQYLSQMAERGATHAVLEVTSHGLAQDRVAGCDFDVAVVTNVTHEHLDFHGSFQAYREAKTRLFSSLNESFRKPGVPKVSVLNRDDESFRYLRPLPADGHVVYALDADADVTARDVVLKPDGTHFTLCTPTDHVPVETRLVGHYNVHNAIAAAATGVALGLSLQTIARGLTSVRGVPGRMERIEEGQSFLAVVDFAHTPNALRQALSTARGMVSPEGRVIVVFGSAGLRDREKRRMMGSIAGELADVIIITAEDPRSENVETIMSESAEAARAEGKREQVDLFRVVDRGEAIWRACQLAHAGDIVIACGKGHEQSMCFGTTEYPWDDREAMRLALRGRRLNTLPTAEP